MIDHVFSPEMMQERERQLMLALLDCAGVCYDINFTQDKIVGTPMQILDGVQYDILAQIGKSAGCSNTEITEYWCARMSPEEADSYRDFCSCENVICRYRNGERLIAHDFFARDAKNNIMLAKQKMRLYEDCTTGDIMGLVYVAYDRELLLREQEKRELEAQAKRLETLSASVPGGYHLCSAQEGYPFIFVSESFEKIVGWTREQIRDELGNLFINLIVPEDMPKFGAMEKSIDSTGEGCSIYRIRRRDGQVRWVQDSTMLTEEAGEQFYQCTLADITEFVTGQEEFARRNSEFETMARSMPCGYHRCSTDEGFRVSFISDSFLEVVGWTYEQLRDEIDFRYMEIVAPEDREMFLGYEPALVRDGQVSLAYRIRCHDGSRRWVMDSTMRVTQDGQEFYQCILTNITDIISRQERLTRRNEELRQKESLMELMEENMPSGYHRCAAEPGCPFIYIGQHFTDIVGFTKEEIERDFGNLFVNLLWDEDVDAGQRYADMMGMRGKGNIYDTSVYRIKHKDGGYRWVTDSTMFVDLGPDSFLQATLADITEHVENLEEARKRAEESSLAKSTFLFNASHDIRTPMNAIQGFARIIEENADNPETVRETVRKITQSGDTLMTLLNDVLELSRIERGKEKLEECPLSMQLHADKLYEMFAAEMEQAGVRFVMKNDLPHPFVMADDLKLTRIAMNLLSNARKFTPRGGTVTFGIYERDYCGDSATYCLYVQDTGIGMSSEFQQRAFEQFERERSSTESGISGSGLGLAIIKKLCDLMGGECRIESQLGVGSEIVVAVPLKLADENADYSVADSVGADFSGRRVLLVEDNDFNREIARYILEGMSFEVEEAADGLDCIDMVLRAEAGYYDVILMDIQMPVMDGYTATAEIRRIAEAQKAAVPIIAMTANAFEEDKRRCLEIGMNGHIGKPIAAETVAGELLRVLRRG